MDVLLDRFRPWFLLTSALLPLAVAGLLAIWRDDLGPAPAVLVLVLVVVAVSATGDRLAGLTAAASSGIFFDAFLTRPYGTLAISDPADVEAFVLLVAVGIAVSELAIWGRRQQARASRSSGYVDGVLAASEVALTREDDAGKVVEVVRAELARVLTLDDCRYVEGTVASGVVVQHDGTVQRAGRAYDVTRHGLPTDDVTALPVQVAGHRVGTYLLTAATRVRRPSREQLRVAVLLADQAGAALTRQR